MAKEIVYPRQRISGLRYGQSYVQSYVQSYAQTLLANGWDRRRLLAKASLKSGRACGFTVGGVGFSEVRVMPLPPKRGGGAIG
ncbi:TPA: hypothetical protein I8Y22_000934 [Raoultella planticola]|nr:hypothetical protein [Raoultella planticola]